ncbi:MAG: CRTAC1 family protein [Acidobacteriota bacterium]
MSEETTEEERRAGIGGTPEDPTHPDEHFDEEDDAVIGVAFRRSLVVIAIAAGIGLLIWLWGQRPREAAPEQGLDAAAPEAVVEETSAPDLPFTDLTQAAGIDFVHFNGAYGDKLLPETMGGGVAFFDYDADDDPDLLFVNSGPWPHHAEQPTPKPTMALYRNDGGGGGSPAFTDVTAAAGLDLSFYGMGAAAADYDGDGDVDLFLTAVGPNRLLRNDGGVFTDVAGHAGVAGGAEEWSSSAAFFDADNDGDLDLFVCNYVRWSKEIDFELDFRLTGIGRAFGPPQSYEGTYPYFYRNNGDGTFADASVESGVQVVTSATGLPMAKSLAVLPVDIDGDGFLDLFIANDTVRNFFFHNLGDGRFEEVGEDYGLAYDRNGNATGAMGVDVGHYRNDANLGFIIGNFANEMSSVYMSQDDPEFFVDEAIGEGIGAPSRLMLTFGLFLFDADLDGRLDLLQANGHIEDEIQQVDPSQRYRQPGQLFWNGGVEQGFLPLDAAATGDLGREIVGRGAAYADIDGDGDLDVALTQIAGPPLVLRNDQALDRHWLRLRLEGTAPNTDAIGAWVEVKSGGTVQRRQVMPSRSYLSSVEPELTFGLGPAETVDSVTVTWPGGQVQELGALAPDRLHVVPQDV